MNAIIIIHLLAKYATKLEVLSITPNCPVVTPMVKLLWKKLNPKLAISEDEDFTYSVLDD